MTKLFKEAVEAVSALPDEMQDELARVLLQLAGVDQSPYELTADEAAEPPSLKQSAASLRRMKKFARSGRSMAGEGSLRPPGRSAA